MNKSHQYKLRKYVFTKTWKLAIAASVSENSVFHVRENPSEAIKNESSQIRELHETILDKPLN